MRVSREKALENREQIIETAARLLREHGFDGIGVADIMKAAGLTHGGFYRNFASKDDLAVKASERAIADTTALLKDGLAQQPKDPFRELVERYEPEHEVRLRVKPGVTGPWQVYGRSELTFDEVLAVEREYVENLSLGRDFRIMLMTIPAVFGRRGAY